MAKSCDYVGAERRTVLATGLLLALSGATMALPPSADAQSAGGVLAGGGQGAAGNVPFDDAGPPEPPQCIRRALDNRLIFNGDENQVTAWVSVRHPAIASILTSGSANGPDMGTFSISVLLNGIPIAHSQESRGLQIVSAQNNTTVHLLPGRQYKISAKATVSRTKRLDLLNLYVGVGKLCL